MNVVMDNVKEYAEREYWRGFMTGVVASSAAVLVVVAPLALAMS